MLKYAVQGIKETLLRGVNKTLDETHIRVLDTRKNGVALDIEVEVKLKTERGNAIIRLYGPYNQQDKKENVIMVTKIKRHHEKFVTILAENVVKPLINEFVKDSFEDIEQDENICSVCEKVFKSANGLKSHITRMHKMNIEEMFSKEVQSSPHETCNKEEKKEYLELCDKCDFKVRAEKKYLALQLLRKHKKDQHPKTCSECEVIAKTFQELKRHERDVHGKYTISTSPPAKRKRNFVEVVDKSVEKMDIDDTGKEEEDNKRKEIDLEKMEIDEETNSFEKIKRELSDKMDKKVIEKRKRLEENEKKWVESNLSKQKKKEDKEKQILEHKKQSNKVNKQRSKDKRKQLSKKKKVEFKSALNIKDVPSNCKKFVNDGDMVYIVPGNGACGPNSGAAHLFQDELLGPTLRIKMNHFLAEHYEVYKNIFPCSKQEPFVRQLNGETISFDDPEELKMFLKTSKDAGYMWSDSEDLKILSDMYQVKIKIITTKGLTDKNPIVNWITPDESMKQFAELQDVEINEMVLLHENDNHFDLIVSGDSQLVKYGNMSGRKDVISENEEVFKEDEDKEFSMNSNKDDSSKEVLDLRREIEKLKKKNELFEKQYMECEKELRMKTEEAERLRSELNDLKLKDSLENEVKATLEGLDKSNEIEDLHRMKKSGFRSNSPDIELSPVKNSTEIFDEKEDEFNCRDCDYQGNTHESLQKHIRLTHTMDKYKCTDCNYQCRDGKELYNHKKTMHENKKEIECDHCDHIGNIKCRKCKQAGYKIDELSKHISAPHVMGGNLKCKTCGKEVETKSKLMIHRKREHPNTVAPCKNYLSGQCDFRAESCWWNHREVVKGQIECYFCEKYFDTKSEVMMHRKKEHAKTVKQCSQFESATCKRNEEMCWFKHVNLDFQKSMESLRNT